MARNIFLLKGENSTMKRTFSAILSLLLVFTALAFVGCGKSETVRLGLGIHTVTKATSASEDADGKGQVTMTVAAVTLDKDGKIVSCQLDTADFTVAYTGEGKAIANDSLKTKYEAGKDYNMVAHGGAAKEWFEQADAFESVVAGKTIDEVKALVVAESNKGTDEVINAGCTIMVNDFVKAIEKAVANAADTAATTADTLKLGVYAQQTPKDAVEDVNGSNKVETTFFAATVDDDGKVTAAASDCVQVEFGFDAAGASTFDNAKAVSSKREAGANYGMVAHGGAAKEWFEQADAFNAACVGKTVSEISGLMGADNYGNADVKAAGCTILVNGFVKAAAKLG